MPMSCECFATLYMKEMNRNTNGFPFFKVKCIQSPRNNGYVVTITATRLVIM